MNAILKWFSGPEWGVVIEALAHSLWQGVVWSLLLVGLLRRNLSSRGRYLLSLGALAGLVLSGVATWAWLDQERIDRLSVQEHVRPRSESVASSSVLRSQVDKKVSGEGNRAVSPAVYADAPKAQVVGTDIKPWQAWAGAIWTLGCCVMLLRCGISVAGANRLCRSASGLSDASVVRLVDQVKNGLGITRSIRVVATDRLMSPAVFGLWSPTLIIPGSLLTTLTMEELRMVLVHELAHIERGDYFVNLIQMVLESLLFFNPSVWWIGRQIRLEREVCCDELALGESVGRTEYARTLLRVAEVGGGDGASVAMAFADRGEPTSLRRRIERIITPGDRPSLRVTWGVFTGCVGMSLMLLAMSAVGTRITVAAVMTSEQRMERIAKLLKDRGETLTPSQQSEGSDTNRATITGRVIWPEGQGRPSNLQVTATTRDRGFTGMTTVDCKPDGTFSTVTQSGVVTISAMAEGYAPAVTEPVRLEPGATVAGVELRLSAGFATILKAVDAETQQGLAGARLRYQYWLPGGGMTHYPEVELVTDASGSATILHGGEMPLVVTLDRDGYALSKTRFERSAAGQVHVVRADRGGAIAGVVREKGTGNPVVGASIQVLYEEGETSQQFQWDDDKQRIASTDAGGRFSASRLRRHSMYWIGVRAKGYESAVWERVSSGATNLAASLGPELVVKGRVQGDLTRLQRSNNKPVIGYRVMRAAGPQSQYLGHFAEVEVRDGVGYFQFTNQVAGRVDLDVGGVKVGRQVDARIADWVVDLGQGASEQTKPVATRDVWVRLKSPAGTTPRGTVEVTLPEKMTELSHYRRQQFAIASGEIRFQVPVGAWFEVQPSKTTVGFWFDRYDQPKTPAGEGPLVVDLPLVPAGVITALAKNSQGEAMSDLSFGVKIVKRSPLMKNPHARLRGEDSWSADGGVRRFISEPLPLGGVYRVVAASHNAFAASQPMALTESQPDRDVVLQFEKPATIEGIVADEKGVPIPGVEVKPGWTLEDHGYGLKSVVTDERGRFVIGNVSPSLGTYHVVLEGRGGYRSSRHQVDFKRLPLSVRLQPGKRIAGRLTQADTGYVIPNAHLRAVDLSGVEPPAELRTNADGQFEFSTLGPVPYRLFISGANVAGNRPVDYVPGVDTNLVLKAVLYTGSELHPVPAR